MKTLLNNRRSTFLLLVLVLTLASVVLNACSPAVVAPPPVQAAPPVDDSRLMNPLPDLWTVRDGEVPAQFIDVVRADLAQRLQIDQKDIQVIRSEAVTYDDGSLGCPKPEEMYIMMQVEGYRVVLYTNEIEFDYRLSDTGHFVMCDLPQP
jgi:hypothetical protein